MWVVICYMHGLFCTVCKSGKVPVYWCSHYKRERDLGLNATVTDQLLFSESQPKNLYLLLDLSLCFRNIDDLTSLDLSVVTLHWMQSSHFVCCQKSISCVLHLCVWRRRLILLSELHCGVSVPSVLCTPGPDHWHTATSARVCVAGRLSLLFHFWY